jgi:hypothetical protein
VESGEWRGEEAKGDELRVLWYGGGLSGGWRGRGGRQVALSSERRDCLKIEIEMFRFRVSGE